MVLKKASLKRVHGRFLESCRNLTEGRTYIAAYGPVRRWILEFISPIPVLALHEEGRLLFEALEWLESHCKSRPLDEDVIRHYHRSIAAIGIPKPGQYRTKDIAVVGSKIPRSAPRLVSSLMQQLGSKLVSVQREWDKERPSDEVILKVAVDTYQRIGLIHPFEDGNGRTARLAMNHLLRRYLDQYIIFPPLGESEALWQALQEAHLGILDNLIAQAQSRTINI